MLDKKVKVKSVTELGAGNYLLGLACPEQASLTRPGQFLMIKCAEEVGDDPLLRRPFSIFSIRRHARTGKPLGLEILVKDVGAGTHKLVQLRPGREIYVLGPQGKSFELRDDMGEQIRFACLVGGGVGIAALLLLAQELPARGVVPILFYGARTKAELVLRDYFERLGIKTCYTTEDGSFGERGLVSAPIERFLKNHARQGVRVYACGPWAMMRAVHRLSLRNKTECEVSLEARMGCSLGACMGCVVRASSPKDEAHFIRVCVEGPVIDSRRINWEFPPL